MAPSSSVWRLQTCAASGSRGVQRPASSLGGQSWLRPSASSDSTSQGAEPKRCRVDARLPETVSKLERKIYLDMAAVMMATETTKKENCYTKWQVNPKRIASALAAPCQCTRTVCQAKTLPFENVCEYVRKYHSLTEECKACLLSSAYDTAGPMPDDRKPRTAWYLLGVRVCTEALEKLLGHSPSKFYKLVHQVPDMRQGTWSVQPRDQPQRRACDQFFAELYMSAAEHLAEQQLDIDNIDDSIAHDEACGPDSVPRPASHEHSPSLDMSWDPDESLSTQMLMATAADLRSWPPRFLQHGRLHHLWWQFLAWWASLQAAMPAADNAELISTPSYPTFWRAWQEKWCTVLRFRKSSSHSRCTQCFQYQEALHRGPGDAASKQAVAANWRKHLQEQYHDRLLYWHLRWFSRQSRVQRPVSSLGGLSARSVLTIIIDSMDKSKLVWPQYSFRKPKSVDALKRPRMVCTLAMAHGWTCEFFLTDDEVLSHGAGHFCEVLSKTLDRVAEMAAREGLEMPRHLVLQSDNTTSQAKNSLVGQFLATLVAAGKFDTCTLNFLEVGHTHEDVDLAFGILLAKVIQRHRVQCPAELATKIEVEMATWAGNRREECHCTVLHRVRDFKGWLGPQSIHIHNCWMTRHGISAPHSFAYKRRHGLTDAELAVSTPSGDTDVFCIVKHRMHSLHPNGLPTLVLPHDRYLALETPAPVQWEAPTPFTEGRRHKLLQLADVLERATENWGPNFSYFRAAAALRELVHGHGCPPLVPGWLGQPGVPAAPAERYTGNVYFGHLPNMSWRMLVAFRG